MTQPIPNAPTIRRLVELGLKVKPNTPSVGDSTIDPSIRRVGRTRPEGEGEIKEAFRWNILIG